MRKTKKIIGNRKILVSDLRREYQAVKNEVDQAVLKVLDSGWYILGRELQMFEQAFARHNGSRYAIGVASGTEALQIAMMALGIGRGDEVITAINTAIPTAMAIAITGARPVFLDVCYNTSNIDISKLQRAINRRTKAVIPVHLYGNPCDMYGVAKIARRNGLAIIEDCAQSQGASIKGKKVGTFSDLGAFSFYPTKNLGAYGDGGMVVTDNKSLADKAKLLRNYGQFTRYTCDRIGINSRLDEIQAAILRVKLKHLNHWNERRRAIASLYRRELSGIREVKLPPEDSASTKQVYHLFVIRCAKRDSLKYFLKAKGIETQIHYPVPLHLQKAFNYLGYDKGDFPVAEALSSEILSLPIFPELQDAEVEFICACIKDFYRKSKSGGSL